MYGLYGASAGLIVFLSIFYIVVWAVSMNLLVKAARTKGWHVQGDYRNPGYVVEGGTGVLWFVGFFGTPLLVGLYVAALPDLALRAAVQSGAKDSAEGQPPQELPKL